MSSQAVIERTLFLGPRTPNYIKSLHKNIVTVKRPIFKQLLKLAVLDFEGRSVTSEMYMSIKNAAADENCNIDLIYGSLYKLLKCALSLPESSLKLEVFKEDLQTLKIPDEYIEDLSSVVFGPRKELSSLKDLQKWHKEPKMDKSTGLENVMVNAAHDVTFNINSLPDEVILEIFSYLKQNQLGQIARVCRRWKMLTGIPHLWKKVNVQISPSHRSPTTVTKDLISRLPSYVTSIRLDLADSAGKLDFEGLCVILKEKCLQLEVLFFTRCKFSCTLSSVIDLCTHFLQNVKKLVFYHCEFSNCRSTDEWGGISKIESLDVLSCVSDSHDPLNKLSFSRMPYLKRLQLFFSNIQDSFFADDITFLNQLCVLNLGYTFVSSRIFDRIRTHGLNLKELCLCLVNLQDHHLNFNDSVFPQLVTICLRDCWDVTCEGVVSIIQSCRSLQNVYVRKHVAESFEVHPFVDANRCKSEIVKAIDCSHSEELDTYL